MFELSKFFVAVGRFISSLGTMLLELVRSIFTNLYPVTASSKISHLTNIFIHVLNILSRFAARKGNMGLSV